MSSGLLSDWLGWTSIACWLGAQFPQVIENYKRQSVEGLALPFLANWLFGDITNLTGCLLTHQLPFQTYLSIYFVSVDCSLLAQYLYYTRKAAARVFPHAPRPTSISRERDAAHYRTLSTVAAHVAATAALAAQQEEHSPRLHRRTITEDTAAPPGGGADDEPSDEALAALAESFRSEGGRVRRKHVSWSRERYGSRAASHGPLALTQSPQAEHDPGGTVRGRALEREDDEPGAAEAAQRKSSRASRRGATLVFLGVWALFGVGSMTGSKTGLLRRDPLAVTTREGRVLGPPEAAWTVNTATVDSSPTPHNASVLLQIPPTEGLPLHFEALEEPSMERIIGRISAWICTTLYLTSRLPQIWKNFVRKSVEGLSVYLFIFAMLGNLFYVSSILTSPGMSLPPAEATAFVKESLPYLLGSSGTLIFDVVIVTQTVFYRRRKPFRPRGLGRSASERTFAEEEAGLMGADSLAEETLARGSQERS